MFHYYESITDTKGNALTGYYVGLVQPDDTDSTAGVTQPIYADEAGTPIVSDSGVDNLAKVDADGNVSLFVPTGEYHVDIYGPDGVTALKRIYNIPMESGEPGATPTIAINSVTTLSAGSSATVVNSGTDTNVLLDFGIPKGDTGSGTGFAWGAATGTLADQTDLQAALDLKADLASPTFTGTPTVPTATVGTNSTQIASTAFVIANAATLSSPGFTGTPTAPTAAADTNTTQLATTAFVVGQASATNPLINGSVAIGTSLKYARADHVHPTDTTRAPLASPGFSGTPTAPTATAGTNTTQIATTAFVTAAVASSSGDPWTIVKLTSDATTFSATPVTTGLSVSGASFLGSHYYEFEAQLSIKNSTSDSVGIRISPPSGVTGSAWSAATNGSTVTAKGGAMSGNIDLIIPTVPSTFIPVTIRGHFYTGTLAATGTLDIQYDNGSGTATISKGSVLRYRAL